MNIIDPILLVLLSFFALRGYFKGLFRESFSLLGLFIGFMAAVRYDEPAAALLADTWKFPFVVLRALSFVGLFFIVYFTFSLAGWLLHRSAKFLFLQTINRVGGIVLGTGKGAAILALIIFFLNSSSFMPQNTRHKINESYLAHPLHQFAQELVRIGKSNFHSQEESPVRDGDAIGYF